MLQSSSLAEGFPESRGARRGGDPFSVAPAHAAAGGGPPGSLGRRPGALGQRLRPRRLGGAERSAPALPQPPSGGGARLETPRPGPRSGAERGGSVPAARCGGALSVAPGAVSLCTPASRTALPSGWGAEGPFLASLRSVPGALLSFSSPPPTIALQRRAAASPPR